MTFNIPSTVAIWGSHRQAFPSVTQVRQLSSFVSLKHAGLYVELKVSCSKLTRAEIWANMCYCSEVNLVKDRSLQLSFDVNSKNSSLCFPSFSFSNNYLGYCEQISRSTSWNIFIQMFSDIKEENPKGYWFKSAGFDYEFMGVKSACWNYNVSQHVLKSRVAQPWH